MIVILMSHIFYVKRQEDASLYDNIVYLNNAHHMWLKMSLVFRIFLIVQEVKGGVRISDF